MWSQFLLAFAVEAAVLLAPGYLFARALRLARPLSLGIAAAVTCSAIEIWTVIAWKLGIHGNWASVVLPVAAVAALAFLLSEIISRKTGLGTDLIGSDRFADGRSQAKTLVLFCIAGIAICGFVLVKNLDGPCSFFQAYDNLSHMMRIKSYVDTGVFSPIGADLNYNLANPPFETHSSSFYPSSWHCLSAVAVSMLGIPVAMSVNVTNAVFAGIAAPLSAWSFLSTVLRGRKPAVCAMLPLAFAAFPWGMIDYGPLYPNMAAFAMMLGVAACFVVLLETRAFAARKIVLAIAFAAGIAGLGLTHPNAVFGLAVLLVPFTCWKIARCKRFEKSDGSHSSGPVRSKARWVWIAAFIAFSVAVWAIALNSSFMHGVVSFTWPSYLSLREAFINLLTFAMRDAPAQLLLGLLVCVGVLYSFRRREYLWMSAALAIAGIMYLVNVTSDGTWKMWLTGFWYQDSYRICGLACLCALPLASLGLTVVYQLLETAVERISKGLSQPLSQRFAAGVLTLACLFGIFYPAIEIPGIGMIDTAFGYTDYLISFENDSSRNDDVLGADERAFLEQVQGIVGSDAVILNHPYDGSAFAAANFDLNMYWRTWGGFTKDTDGQASQTLRYHASEMAYDEQVQQALKESGAQYLLLLDQGTLADEEYMENTTSYHPESWVGIESIDDSTPGLEPLLSKGDMRLYRITATESEYE